MLGRARRVAKVAAGSWNTTPAPPPAILRRATKATNPSSGPTPVPSKARSVGRVANVDAGPLGASKVGSGRVANVTAGSLGAPKAGSARREAGVDAGSLGIPKVGASKVGASKVRRARVAKAEAGLQGASSLAASPPVVVRRAAKVASPKKSRSITAPLDLLVEGALDGSESSVTVSVTNNWSFLRTLNTELFETIQNSLTVARKVFKPTFPPSKISFITKKGRFGTGLLPIILNKLTSEKATYTLNDQRTPMPELFAADDATENRKYTQIDEAGTLFEDVGVKLRDYQVKAVNAALQHHRGIIKCATGGGKTWILAAILKALGGNVPAVIVVNQRVLAEQLFATLKKAGLKDVGMLIGGTDEPNTITICTIQTLQKNKAKQQVLAEARVLMVDEVHEYATKLSRDTFNAFPKAYMRLGFSATPFKRPDHKHVLMSSFGPALVDVSIDELVEKQVITNSVVNFYPITQPIIDTASSWHVAEMKGIINNQYFHDSVVALVNSIPSGRIMILVQRIAHGDALHKLLPGSFWISGKDDSEARGQVLEKLRSSTATKVVALVSSIGFVGVDVFVHHLINAAGGREAYLTIQKIGRGLRRASDKDVLYYHDFLFSLNMNRMLCGQSLARIRTLKQSGYEVLRQPAIIRRPQPQM
eukprot:Phypoly_transcript_04130.p1 GENE.Phypoly_transcript_04130~~Phypoly_transcript_04130.p1  ORF type:complete len:649 (+),score=96.52 Phypoly_transcript_04130:273-2219(+)